MLKAKSTSGVYVSHKRGVVKIDEILMRFYLLNFKCIVLKVDIIQFSPNFTQLLLLIYLNTTATARMIKQMLGNCNTLL